MKRRPIVRYTVAAAVAGVAATRSITPQGKLLRIAPDSALGQTAADAPSDSTSSDSTSDPASTVRWRIATSYPKLLDLLFGAVELFCQRVSELTDGRFVITPYPAGDIVPALEVLDAVSQGTVECGHTFSTYYIEQSPALAFSAGVPFGFTAQQQSAWLYEGGGLEAIRRVYQRFNVINFPAGNTGAQMGGWFQREIQRTSDLKGLKMRIPGLAGQIMSRLGAEIKMLAADEIVQAFAQGEVEAVELTGPYDDSKLGLHKAARFYYYPAWWQPSESLDVIINLEQWNQLSPQFQKVIEIAAIEANILTLAKYNAGNTKMLQRLKAEGVQLKSLNTEILEAAEQATFAVYEDIASRDPEFSQVYQPWKTFRDRIYQWHRINELSFANFAFTNHS